MALFVHITDACRKEASSHSFEEALARLTERVERTQDTRHFDPFPPPYLVKKQFGARQGRLVAERHIVHHEGVDHNVIVFVSVLIRGERAYDSEFGKDPERYGESHFRGRFTQDELKAVVAERLQKDPPEEKPPVKEEEYGYLYQVLGQHGEQGDKIVCESADWVSLMSGAPFKNWHPYIFKALENADLASTEMGISLEVPGKSGWGILCRRFPERRIVFLCGPYENASAEEILRARYSEILTATNVTHEAILKASKRAYPDILLADGDLWLELQKEELGNLALSPEETQILESTQHGDRSFPLFINGRAGSGKSTILQYLFTDFLFYHLQSRLLPHPPVYFTCNHELLNTARRVVETLVRIGGKYWASKGRDLLLDDSTGIFDAAFREFHSHLLNLVPAEVRDQQFSANRYVSFATFRKLWMRKFSSDRTAMRDYNAELCWHVIRTYIKGASADALLDPEEYLQIDQKQRSVSQEAYEWVFTKVWERWYLPLSEDEKYWDDQDLARYLIERELIKPTYPAIFCDEAQDFTRLELEAILRMSIFSERKMAPVEISRVPFVFAGDQFQTLNPTGFRWEAVKAWFAEKFIFALDPSRQSGLSDLTYRELNFNYRSTRSIVGFSNFVQALRVSLFEVTGVSPQEPWEDGQSAPVMLFKPEEAAFWEALERFTDLVFVVPCSEGEEVAYLTSDPILSKRIPLVDGVPSRTVLSAASAKGLEFNRVVVYGFGSDAPECFLSPLEGKGSHVDNRDASLPLEYFINRLYVAISRPKRQLLIVDTAEGVSKLWRFAQEATLEEGILSRIRKGREIWADHLVRPVPGNVSQIDTTTPIDVEGNAKALAGDGRSSQNPYKLRSAAIIYRNAQMEDQATLCLAEADELEGNFESAGKAYLRIENLDAAMRCFWNAEDSGWPLILDAGKSRPAIVGRLEYHFADYLSGTKAPASGFSAIEKFRQVVAGDQTSDVARFRKAWLRAVVAVIDSLLTKKTTDSGLDPWERLDESLNSLSESGFSIPSSTEADIAFKAGNFAKAARLLESNGLTDSQKYKIAKAESTGYPERIEALAQIGSWDRILEEWRANPEVQITGSQSSAIARALAKKGLLDEAFDHAVRSKQYAAVAEVKRVADSSKKVLVARRIAPLHAALAVKEEKWDDVLTLMKGVIDAKQPEATGAVRGLARSQALAVLPGDAKFGAASQGSISGILRKIFLVLKHDLIDSHLARDIGAAIERAGNRIDALKYYEEIEHHRDPEIAAFARERWIVAKERQAANDDKRGDKKGAQDRRREASEARKKLGKASAAFPEFPDLSNWESLLEELAGQALRAPAELTPRTSASVATSEVFADQAPIKKEAEPSHATILGAVEVSKAPFRFEFFRNTGRLNITRSDTGETGNVKDWGSKMAGDWEFSPAAAPSGGRCFKAVGLPFTLLIAESGDRIEVCFQDEHLTISFS